jgi:hypothetical protein
VSQAMIFRIFLVFSAISIVVCGTTFLIFRKRLGLSKRGKIYTGLFLLLIAILIVVGPLTYRLLPDSANTSWQHLLQFSQFFLMGWVGINFMVLMALEIVQAIAKPFDPQKRIFLTEGLTRGIVAGTSIAAFGGLFGAMGRPKITPITITLPTLPQSFQGITIAQISDIHIGPILKEGFLDGVVEEVMSLNADMIFITGDLVDGTVDQLKSQVEPLKRLKAKDGIYFCTGNHEFYSGVGEWINYLESIGIHVFENSNIILNRKNAVGIDEKLMIAGVHDWHGEQFSDHYKSDPFLAAKTSEPVNSYSS